MPSTIERLKQGISSYGKMLKNAYIPSHKKKQIKQSIASMQKEVKRLQEIEKLEKARLRVDMTRAKIQKVRSSTPKSGLMKWLEDSPDYLGTQGRKGGGGRRGRRGGGGFDLDFDL